MDLRRERGFSLVEILVVMLIIMILAAILLPRYLGEGKNSIGQRVQSPIKRAKSVECINYLAQIRQAYQMATMTGDEYRPQSLADLRSQGVSESMMKCPVGGQPFVWDPMSGRVARCTYPSHETN